MFVGTDRIGETAAKVLDKYDALGAKMPGDIKITDVIVIARLERESKGQVVDSRTDITVSGTGDSLEHWLGIVEAAKQDLWHGWNEGQAFGEAQGE